MRVCAQRNAAPCFSCQSQQINIQVLAIGIAIDLHCLMQRGCFVENLRPFGRQAHPVVVNATTWVSENLDRRIAQCGDVAWQP